MSSSRDYVKITSTSSSSTDSYEALKVEYSEMASWYDSFWADYLTKTFQLPLKLLAIAVSSVHKLKQHQNQEDNGDMEKQKLPKEETTVIVDIACGTGEFIKRAQERLATIKLYDATETIFYGVEPCPEMLKEAMPKTTSNTKWIQSTAENLPLADGSADIICSTNAFHFFRNKPLALTQMYRTLKPGGRLIITDWSADYFLVRLYHIVEMFRWNFSFSDRYPGPLPSRTLQWLVEDAGFDNVKVETYCIRFWTVVVWGMQTVTATKKKPSLSRKTSPSHRCLPTT